MREGGCCTQCTVIGGSSIVTSGTCALRYITITFAIVSLCAFLNSLCLISVTKGALFLVELSH